MGKDAVGKDAGKDATTRRGLMVDGARMAAAGAAGAGAAAAGLSVPAVARAASTTTTETGPPPPESAPTRLNRMLSVELLLLFSYQHVLSTSPLTPRAASVLDVLRTHEEAHVHALSVRLTALGGTPPTPPASVAQANRDLAHRHISNRLGQLRGVPDALRLLLAVERVTVGVYFVALTDLADPGLIRLVAEIMANDAQHEALLGELLYHGNVAMAVPYGLIQGLQ